MSWRLAKSLVRLRAEVLERWPDTTVWTVGDADHRTRRSDHNPNSRGVVTAIDVVGEEQSRWLWSRLRSGRDPRVKYVIHASQMFSSYPTSTSKPWAARPYSGSNPHNSHIHVSVSADPETYDDGRPWGIADAKEDDVTTEQLQQTLKDAGFDPGPVDNIWGPRTQAAFVKALKGGQGSHTHDVPAHSHTATVTVK